MGLRDPATVGAWFWMVGQLSLLVQRSVVTTMRISVNETKSGASSSDDTTSGWEECILLVHIVALLLSAFFGGFCNFVIDETEY